MRTVDFIKRHCVGETCPDFDYRHGCRAYDGEECDEAFIHPRWHGMKMVDRITILCEKEAHMSDLLSISPMIMMIIDKLTLDMTLNKRLRGKGYYKNHKLSYGGEYK